MIYKGKEVSSTQLEKITGIHAPTLKHRYDVLGLRDDELVKPVGQKDVYQIDGKPYRMNAKESRMRGNKKISTNEIQNRLDLGMSMTQALSYSRKYAAKFGTLCYIVEGDEVFYYIPLKDVERLTENGISMRSVSRRIDVVEDISELLLEDTTVYEEHCDYDQSLYDELLKKKQEKAINKMRDDKHRELKPHLYDGTPQAHEFGEYAQYLIDSYTFKCKEESMVWGNTNG